MTNLNIQIQQTEKLILDTREYINSLKLQPLIATPIVLAAEARRKGASVEMCDRYIEYCNVLNEQITQSTIIYLEQLCIPYLEKLLSILKEAQGQ